jgi:ATP-dependent Lhr-like helicase
VHDGTQLHGRDGLLAVVGQLQGLELPARAWESQVLPARIAHYDPLDLEGLCLSGAVAWGRLGGEAAVDDEPESPRAVRTGSRGPTRAAPLAFVLREDLPWLLASAPSVADLPADARAVLQHLERRGASFLTDIARATGLLPAAAEDALWTLVARGLVTGDGTAGLRALLKPESERRQRRLRAVRGGRARLLPSGRWSLLREGLDAAEVDALRCARQLLRRWGVVVREMLAREARMPRWRVLLGALRTLEARGEIRGGRFVSGMVGEQFALPEAVESLRAVRRRAEGPETVVVAAADPLNLVGILVPGGRIPPAAREVIAFRDGVPVESGELGAVRSRLCRPETLSRGGSG